MIDSCHRSQTISRSGTQLNHMRTLGPSCLDGIRTRITPSGASYLLNDEATAIGIPADDSYPGAPGRPLLSAVGG